MVSNRTVYHVVAAANGERWLVTEENAQFCEEYETKAAAIEAARARARHVEPSQVKVHDAAGRMEDESSFGDDSRQPPG